MVDHIAILVKLSFDQLPHRSGFGGMVDHPAGQFEAVSEDEQRRAILDQLGGVHWYYAEMGDYVEIRTVVKWSGNSIIQRERWPPRPAPPG